MKDGTRDGALVLIRSDGAVVASAASVAPSLQQALDHWEDLEAALLDLAACLEAGQAKSLPVADVNFMAPLPRAYEWIDGSAYLNHVRLVRKARGAEFPKRLEREPLVYQGGSGHMLGPCDELVLMDEAQGLDFESEICVILGDTPRLTTAEGAGQQIRLLMLANDVSLRGLIPDELSKGFGFITSKPATAFAPFAITPDELGPAWSDGRAHLTVRSTYNGRLVGAVDSGPEMHFSFHQLIAHITQTRDFVAGTVLGSGTVSNSDRARGVSCLAEQRMIETIETGAPITPFMRAGDRVAIEALDAAGRSPFGRIEQVVVPYVPCETQVP